MRILKTLFGSAALLLASAVSAPLLALQDTASPVQVDVHTTETHTVWYTDPMWLIIGGIVILLVIVLLVLASRGRESSTTVIR